MDLHPRLSHIIKKIEAAKPTAIKEVAPSIATNQPVAAVTEKIVQNNEKKELRKKQAALSLSERKKLAFEEMKKRPVDLEPKSNRIFRTGIEASMARIFMTKLGDPPPPPFTTAIPLRDEAHLVEILIANNPVLESDTEAQRESKAMVELAKKEMAAYIREGGDPKDFLAYYHGKLRDAFEFRRDSAKSFVKVLREEPEIAREYLDELNKNLADKGISAIKPNEQQKKKMGME